MDSTETFLPTTTKPATDPDFFDFVDQTEHPFNRSLKTLGVFMEPNNNETKSEVKNTGSEHFSDSLFWNDKDNMRLETAVLDDLNEWNSWGSKDCASDNTDGNVYTLTVLNTNDTWYKAPEDTSPKKTENLDLDFLNTIPEANQFFYNTNFEQKPFFEDSGYCENKNDPFDVNFNNNSWKTNQNDSLLRNALQGKNLQRSYTCGSKKIEETFCNNFDQKDSLEDIFTEINTITEDFEKLKDVNLPMCSGNMFVNTTAPPPCKLNSKKYTKRNQSIHIKNGVRKERSLHYCTICSKGFKDKYSVNVHVRTHTGEKPFACTLCGKSFRQKAHLAKHYQTHLAQSQKHHLGNTSCTKTKPTIKNCSDNNR